MYLIQFRENKWIMFVDVEWDPNWSNAGSILWINLWQNLCWTLMVCIVLIVSSYFGTQQHTYEILWKESNSTIKKFLEIKIQVLIKELSKI